MTYVKLDDGFFRNPKVVGVGPEARLLYLAGLCYASSSLTDGLIPSRAVRVLAVECEADDPIAAVAQLLDAGLWEEDDSGGYRIHDYLDHNRSKAEIAEISAKRSLAGSLGGRPPTNGKANGKQIANHLPEQRKSKRNPDTDTDTDTDTEKTTTIVVDAVDDREDQREESQEKPKRAAANAPWSMLEALCDELGQDATTLSKPSRERQLAAAKRLIASGFTENDARAMVRWLAPQNWVNGAVDFGLIEKQRGKWELAGKPDAPPAPRETPTPIRSPSAGRRKESPGETRKRLAALESDAAFLERTGAPDWKIKNVRREIDAARSAMEAVS